MNLTGSTPAAIALCAIAVGCSPHTPPPELTPPSSNPMPPNTPNTDPSVPPPFPAKPSPSPEPKS